MLTTKNEEPLRHTTAPCALQIGVEGEHLDIAADDDLEIPEQTEFQASTAAVPYMLLERPLATLGRTSPAQKE